jgi:pimeloyl-ACP methyl ester carboxylesterase
MDMKVERYGPEGGPNLVCIMGWGNRLDHENVEWLLTRFTSAGYRVHAFRIPDIIADFERDYVAPVDSYLSKLGEFRLVGHSAGGLVAAYIDGARTMTFLSPFWGFPRGVVGIEQTLLSLVSKLPVTRPVLPSGTATRQAIGGLATDRQLCEGPSRAAPTFIRESIRAHRDLPPIDDEAVVFCTLADHIVSTRAIGKAVPAERTVLYDGGHELFSSRSREDHVDTLLAAVDGGASALGD